MQKLVVPSVLSADFARLGEEIQSVENEGANRIHLDVMDGHFVPNITFGPMIVEAINRLTDAHLEVHLMIESPGRYIPDFAHAGADTILIQQETCPHLHRDLHLISDHGARPGVVLNPGTPVETISAVLSDIEQILIMTVNPGFGGQSFIESMLAKIRQTRNLIGSSGIRLEVDGGIDLNTIDSANQAGADLFVVGSSIFGEPNPGEAYRALSDQLRILA